MKRLTSILIWGTLGTAATVPVLAAATSPLLAWRQPIYIAGGFTGIIAMVLLLVQPLLAGGILPGLTPHRRRRLHRQAGACLVAAIALHVVALWITSPPDVIDALLFVSPTPFSDWGVVAMWACFAAALLAVIRRKLPLRWHRWRLAHSAFVTITILGSVVHAMLIDGTMEMLSKTALCALVLAATVTCFAKLRVWETPKRRSQ